MNTPFTTTRTFSIGLSGTVVLIEAQIAFASYMITSARCPAGHAFDMSLDDLEDFERYVEDRIEQTSTMAVDLETGETQTFIVHAIGSDILAVQNAGIGYRRAA